MLENKIMDDLESEKVLFNEWMSVRNLSTKTKQDYTGYLKKFNGYKNFNQDFVDNFVQDVKGCLPGRAFLKNYQQFLRRMFPDNADILKIEIPKSAGRRPTKIPDYLLLEEVKLIEKMLEREEEKIILLLFFYTGLRAGGMFGLTLRNFNWEEWKKDETKPCYLKVNEKGSQERIVYVPSMIMRRLRQWILAQRNIAPDDIIWTIKYGAWKKRISKYGRKALGKRVHTHLLRHSYSTWLSNEGFSLQQISHLLGHKSIATTQRYVHLDTEKIMEKYSNLPI